MAKTVRYVPTFRAPSEYERQMEEARRRAMLAEALAQQQYEPMEGNAAPIPKAAPLVKALQGYLTARAGRQAQEAAEEAKGMEADYAQRMLGRMQGGYTYQPDAELETQMAKRPEETLDQYNQRMQATPFVGRSAVIPEQTELGEVTRQSQYRRAPEEVLDMASTSLGTAALKDRPLMAQRLAQMLETPKAEEFYAPTETADGKLVQFGKGGGKRETGYAAPPKSTSGSSLSKLIAERDALPPTSPLRAIYDSAIAKETTNQPPFQIDFGPKDTFKFEADLRSEVKEKLKDYDAVRSSYQKIENALKTGAGDIAVVYAFAKLNDPTSVVRESEFATVAKSGSLGQRIKNLVEQAQSGKMNPELRENLRQQARQMYLSQQANAESIVNQYRDLANTYKLDPNKVLAGININNLAAKEDEDVIDLPPRPRGRGR